MTTTSTSFDRWAKIISFAIIVIGFIATISIKLLAADFATHDELNKAITDHETSSEKIAKERQDATNARLDDLATTMRDVHKMLLEERRGRR